MPLQKAIESPLNEVSTGFLGLSPARIRAPMTAKSAGGPSHVARPEGFSTAINTAKATNDAIIDIDPGMNMSPAMELRDMSSTCASTFIPPASGRACTSTVASLHQVNHMLSEVQMHQMTIYGRRFGNGSAAVHPRPKGQPSLAAYANDDEDHLIFRKFGYLRCRVAFYCQEELAEIERELETMDKLDEQSYPGALQSTQVDHGQDKLYWRKQLLQKAKIKIAEYGQWPASTPRTCALIVRADKLLFRTRTYLSFALPKPQAVDTWDEWIRDNSNLEAQDIDFLNQTSDVVALAPDQERGTLDNAIERLITWCKGKGVMQVSLSNSSKNQLLTLHGSGLLYRHRREHAVTQDTSVFWSRITLPLLSAVSSSAWS
ncbi:MAG: hypothetical protein Q9217_002152 [Psora testacea]